MDRRSLGIDPASGEDEPPVGDGRATAPDPLAEALLDRVFPPIDEDDPEWQSYVRRKIRESLDDPRPDLSADEVAESLRAHHEERLRRGP